MEGALAIARPQRFFAPWEFVESLINVDYDVVCSKGALIEENRNDLLNKLRQRDWMLMVDTDTVFTNEDVEKLVAHYKEGKDMITGIVRKGFEPHDPSIYKSLDPVEGYKEIPEEVIEVEGCGMAFVLISRKVMNSVGFRAFDRITKDNILWGEDLSFCKRVQEAGFKIHCDPSVRVGHVRSQIIV